MGILLYCFLFRHYQAVLIAPYHMHGFERPPVQREAPGLVVVLK